MSERIMWKFDVTEVEKDIREVSGAEPKRWDCSCGCSASLVWARNSRALWIASTLSQDGNVLRVIGLETHEELESYLSGLSGDERGLVRSLLRASFAEDRTKPS